MSNTITPFNKNCVTKVTFTEQNYFWDLEHTQVRCFSPVTKTLKPSVFGASTDVETIRAGYQLTFGIKALCAIKSIAEQADGSFLVENDYGTLRFTLVQEAYVPQRKSTEEYVEEMACMWHDWE